MHDGISYFFISLVVVSSVFALIFQYIYKVAVFAG